MAAKEGALGPHQANSMQAGATLTMQTIMLTMAV
jgi:hypothetical protein